MTFGVFVPSFRPVFDPIGAVAAPPAGNGLLNNLVAYWPLNEASGDAYDLHSNGLALTDNNTVTSATGLVYTTARQYTRSNSEFHKRDSETALQVSATGDFTVAAWIYMDSTPGQMYIITKGGLGWWDYALDYETGNLRFWFWSPSNGTAEAAVTAPGTGEWHFVVGWNDHVANTVSIQLDNGTVVSTSRASARPLSDNTNDFLVGTTSAAYFDGRIGPLSLWKSAAGGGGVLTAAQRTALYNGGAGLAYAAFTT